MWWWVVVGVGYEWDVRGWEWCVMVVVVVVIGMEGKCEEMGHVG